MSTVCLAYVQRQNAGKADDAAHYLAQRHAVALEEDAGHDNYREDAERVENGSP